MGTTSFGNQQRRGFKRQTSKIYVETRIYLAEIFTVIFAIKINQNYMVAIDQCPLKVLILTMFLREKYSRNNYPSYDSCSIFHSFMSDDISQDSATPGALTNKIFQWLFYNTYINTTDSNIWEDTYGCTEQYICTTAIHIFSILAHDYQIVIDRAICCF